MFYFIMLVLVGYAVRCDDSSYYVIQIQEDEIPNEMRPIKPFKVYWNVPTMQCASKKIPFEGIHQKYGIIQNENDRFRGEKIVILYDPGIFPALLKNETSGDMIFRNGGVPQEGDLERHLMEFARLVEQSILKDFSGVGIIDFESWRPIYRQNFGVLTPYKEVSYEIERTRHWWWTKSWLQAEAMYRFEKAGKQFMHKTLTLAKQLRPNALWGYYAYPYCFNMAGNHLNESCAKNVPQENDRLSWLWSTTTALYPSVYGSKDLSTQQLQQLIRGRIKEAQRNNFKNSPIFPYFWFKYRDGGFLSQKDLKGALETIYRSSASGLIIWGSSNDVNTKEKCLNLLDYLNNTLGPAIAKYTKRNRLPLQEEASNTENDDIILNNKPVTTINTNSTQLIPDPELDWDPPENYTQYISQFVQNELKRDINLTNNNAQLGNESATLDRRKNGEGSPNPLNSTLVVVSTEEKELPNIIEENNNFDIFDENKSSSNVEYVYLIHDNLNCTSIDDVISLKICDNYSNSTNKNSVLKSDIDGSQLNVTKDEVAGTSENYITFTTEVSFQHTDSSNIFVHSFYNTSVISQNSSSTIPSPSTAKKNTNNSLIGNKNGNKSVDEYNFTHKDNRKGYSMKPKVEQIQLTTNNEESVRYRPANYINTLANDKVLPQNNLYTESDDIFTSTTEIYLEHKNKLRHSKNGKKGKRRNLKYHTTDTTIFQDSTTIDSTSFNLVYTTEVTPNDLPFNESTRPPEEYQLRGAKNLKKGYQNMKTHIEEEAEEAEISESLNYVKDKLEPTTSSDILVDNEFTTDQVIIYEVVQE